MARMEQLHSWTTKCLDDGRMYAGLHSTPEAAEQAFNTWLESQSRFDPVEIKSPLGRFFLHCSYPFLIIICKLASENMRRHSRQIQLQPNEPYIDYATGPHIFWAMPDANTDESLRENLSMQKW